MSADRDDVGVLGMQRSGRSPSWDGLDAIGANPPAPASNRVPPSSVRDVARLDRAPLLAAALLTALAYLTATAPPVVTAALLGFVAATFDDARRSRAGGILGAVLTAALAVPLYAVMGWSIDQATLGGVALAVATSRLANRAQLPEETSAVTTATALAIAALAVPATTPGWWCLATILIVFSAARFDTARFDTARFDASGAASERQARLISSAFLVAGFGAAFELLGVANRTITQPTNPIADSAMLVVAAGAALGATAARRLRR